MYNKCSVVMDNEFVTVVECKGKQIQFPHKETKSKELYVEYKDGKYSLLDEIPKTKPLFKKQKTDETTCDIQAEKTEEKVVLEL